MSPTGSSLVANGAKRWLTNSLAGGGISPSAWRSASRPWLKVSPALTGGHALPWLTVGAALVPLSGSWVLGAALFGKNWWTRPNDSFRRFDTIELASCSTISPRRKSAQWTATALLFGGWLLETVDALVILRLLGAPVGFTEVIASRRGWHSCVAWLSSLQRARGPGSRLPGVLGCSRLARAAALGAAFVLMKRAKEAVFIVIGSGIFLALRRTARSTGLAMGALP